VSDDGEHRQAGEALVLLRARVDAHFEAARARTPTAIKCRSGCDECCHVRLSVFTIEAARISRVLSDMSRSDPELRQRIREQVRDPNCADRCPMLIDSCCAIYDERPMICRSHGLPVANVDGDGQLDTRWCHLNFRDIDPPAPSVLALSAVNQPLSVMARMWDGRGDRIELVDLAAALDG
jgi:uncharacterized protein